MGATYTRQSSSAIVDGAVIEAADINAEFDQILAAFAVSTGHTHDGTAGEGGPITKLLGSSITIGDATAGNNIAVTFDGESSDGVLTWMEDEDYFQFSDDILISSTEKLQFRDTAIYINSSADGQLDLVADTEIQIAATTIDINGAVDISGALTLAGTTLAETISDTVGAMVTSNTESGITVAYDDSDNTLDFTVGTLNQDTTGNAATATALETARTIHGVSFDGTANIDLSEVISDTVGAMVTSNTESGITVAYQDADNTLDFTIGTLNQDTTGTAATVTGAAQSNITSLGTLTTLTVDNVIINGSTIGHTGDTDLITVASGIATVAGEVSMTTLDIGGTNVTATAAELNLIDGGTSTGSITLADADGFFVNDDGVSKLIPATDIKTYIGSSTAADDLTAGDAAVTLSTTSGNITIDATANDSDIIFKGTDATADITMLTLDGSAAGAATFNDKIIATELDISGNVDVDGTLEADAITVDGTTLAEFISDTAGAMFSSNTETGITATYQDADNTIDLALAAAQTTITSLLATDIKIGEDDQTKIDFETADTIHFYAGNQNQLKLVDGGLVPLTTNDVDLGTASLQFKNVYVDGTTFTDALGFGTTVMTLPTADGNANQILITDGSGALSFADNSGGTSWQSVKTGNYTASAGEGVFANTTSSAFTVTLPASPSIGDEVSIKDYAGTFDTNNLTVGRNSQPIEGVAADLTVSVERAGFTLAYSDGTQGWLLKDK